MPYLVPLFLHSSVIVDFRLSHWSWLRVSPPDVGYISGIDIHRTGAQPREHQGRFFFHSPPLSILLPVMYEWRRSLSRLRLP